MEQEFVLHRSRVQLVQALALQFQTQRSNSSGRKISLKDEVEL